MKTKSQLTEKKVTSQGLKIHPSLKQYTGYCFYKLAMRFRAMVDEEFEPIKIIAPQAGMLTVLAEAGPMTQNEMSHFMAIDKASMVRLVDSLESLGYVVRGSREGDRRAKVLEITKAGEKIRSKVSEARKRAEKRFMSPLSEKERDTFRDILFKLVD